MEKRPNAAAFAAVKARILAEIAALQTNGDGVFDAQSWADFGALGSRLTKAGVAWKSCGVSGNFTAFMEAAFRDEAERGEIVFTSSKTGTNASRRVRLTKTPAKKAVAASSVPEKKSTVAVKTAIPASSSASPGVPANAPKKLSDAELEKRVGAALRALQKDAAGRRDPSAWVDFTVLGPRLKTDGVDCKAFGCASYPRLLEARFPESLQIDKSVPTVCRVRPTLAPNQNDAELADWAVVASERFDELAELALPEKWRFGDAKPAPGSRVFRF